MIAMLPLLAFVQAASQQRADDIVVTARAKPWRAVLVFERDVPTCRILQSSDDAELDRSGCADMIACFTVATPRFAGLRDVPAAARERRRAEIDRDMTACFGDTRRRIAVQVAGRERTIP